VRNRTAALELSARALAPLRRSSTREPSGGGVGCLHGLRCPPLPTPGALRLLMAVVVVFAVGCASSGGLRPLSRRCRLVCRPRPQRATWERIDGDYETETRTRPLFPLRGPGAAPAVPDHPVPRQRRAGRGEPPTVRGRHGDRGLERSCRTVGSPCVAMRRSGSTGSRRRVRVSPGAMWTRDSRVPEEHEPRHGDLLAVRREGGGARPVGRQRLYPSGADRGASCV
jgi:hypothetical protein